MLQFVTHLQVDCAFKSANGTSHLQSLPQSGEPYFSDGQHDVRDSRSGSDAGARISACELSRCCVSGCFGGTVPARKSHPFWSDSALQVVDASMRIRAQLCSENPLFERTSPRRGINVQIGTANTSLTAQCENPEVCDSQCSDPELVGTFVLLECALLMPPLGNGLCKREVLQVEHRLREQTHTQLKAIVLSHASAP